MDISKIKIGSKTYDLKDAASRTKLAGIESGAQAHKAPTSSEITTALGYTPYNATNPNGYTSNTGTVTGVKVGSSGSTISPSSGVITIPAYESGAQVHKAPTTAEVKSALGTGSGTSKYLREDGTWATPPDNNTTYSAATTSAAGLMSAADKTKLDGIATGATANTGTITGIKMNGASKGTSGVVDLGTVITAHQDISGKVNTSTTVNGHALTGNVSVTKSDVGLGNVTNDSQVKRSEMGAASGVATLDSSGKVPSSQLPSYVDDVIEAYYKAADGKFYTTLSSGTYSGAITGETGKIYVDLSTSRTYRWGGSAYTEIKASPGTLDDITDGSTYVRMTSAERTKLSGIATGATANTGTITKVGNTSSGAVTVSSSNNTASFGNAVTVGSVGGVDLKFTMPGNPNTNTWRPIQVGGTDKLTDSSTKLNFAGSGATSVSYSNGTVTISSTDNNTVTSINGKTGAIAAADIATVLTGAGYKLTDTNTWKAATTSQEGYVPTLALSGTSSGAKKDTINTQASDYVLTYTSGTETAPVWRKLPANAYANSTYTVNNGTFTVKGAGTAVSSTSANASGNTAVDFVAGSNVTITPDATNGKITIASTDTNTWRPVGTGASDAAAGNHTHTASLASDTGTSAITLAHGGKYKLTAGGQSVIFTMPSDNNTTYSAGTGLSLSGTTFALATSGVTAGTYKRVTVDAYGRVTSGDNTDADSWRTVQCNGTSIGNNTLNLKAGSNVSLSNSNGTITISSTDTNTWPTKTSQLTNDSGFLTSNAVTSVVGNTGAVTAAQIGTALTNAGYKLTDNNTTYNFSGTSFTSNNSTAVNANDVAYNAHTYYTSNGPGTSLGASTNDGALYSQAYSTSWVGQIAQDYRNGGLYVRGKNNGTWQSWYRVWDSRSLTNLNQLSNGPGYITGITKAMVTNALGYTPPTTNTTYSGSSTVTLSGTTFSLTKANVTTALGYTPPTSDTNTWRPLGTGANDACAGNDSRLSNSRPASDVYSWAKASSKPGYSYGEISHAVNSVTTSGAISLAGTTPLHIVTLNGNASSVALSSNPATGHSCHVIFFSTAERTVAIAHHATSRVCPEAKDVSLKVPANGYVEVDFLFDGTKTWVRGV